MKYLVAAKKDRNNVFKIPTHPLLQDDVDLFVSTTFFSSIFILFYLFFILFFLFFCILF